MRPYERFKLPNIIAGLTLCAIGFTVAYVMRDRQAEQKATRGQIATPHEPTVSKSTQMDDGELLQIQVPHDPLDLGIVEVQTCWVWRDAKMATASISCPAPPTLSAQQ